MSTESGVDGKAVSSDQTFYDERPAGTSEQHEVWMREIEFYFHGYSEKINDLLLNTGGSVAELGAGSCGLSLCLSMLPRVNKVASLDISLKRMEKMIDLSFSVLGGNKDNITPIACDFNGRLPFEDEELDAVFFDAALHHTRSMWATLSECNRVLRPGGFLVAQRESYLSPIRAKHQIANLLKMPEVAANVSENMYLKEQYFYYLVVNGFDVTFLPRSQSLIKQVLAPLNGMLFCDGVLFCEKIHSNKG